MTTIVSLLVGLPLADDAAGFPETLQPMPAKPSTSDKAAAQKAVRTVENDLDVGDIDDMSFATRLRS
jgi:hypothetical protein